MRVTRSYWDLIVTVKHPVMAGRVEDVKEVLENPDEVRLSRSDPSAYLFYRPIGGEQLNFSVTEPEPLRVTFETMAI